MASLSSSSRKRVRYNLDVTFSSYEEKEAFLVKLKNTRQHLTPSGSHPMDNYSLKASSQYAAQLRDAVRRGLPHVAFNIARPMHTACIVHNICDECATVLMTKGAVPVC